VTGEESCGVCADTGFVDHNDGDAHGCNYCQRGVQKVERFFNLKHSYAVNDITPATHKGRRLSLREYAQSEAGKRDPHLDSLRQAITAMRRSKRTQNEDVPQKLVAP